jgi:hypothetical protein
LVSARQGLQPGKAREDYPFKDPAKRNKGGRPLGSVNRYTGALKELFLLAAENVGDRLKNRKKVARKKSKNSTETFGRRE